MRKTTYIVENINDHSSYVTELYCGVKMKKIFVNAVYNGGNILKFINSNDHYTSWFNYDHSQLWLDF